MITQESLRIHLKAAGFVIVSDAIASANLEILRTETDRLLSESSQRGGARNVLNKSALLRKIAEDSPLAQLAKGVLGANPRATKLTIFDKAPNANWKVAWHQDLTIIVRERIDIPGFGPWSLKDGLHHVQPPAFIFEQILAIRLHLDDTPATNGALRVLPGTHKLGRLSADQISRLRGKTSDVICPVAAGGAMLMSPLLLHASSPAESPSRRRVLHFEYSTAELPGKLCWV